MSTYEVVTRVTERDQRRTTVRITIILGSETRGIVVERVITTEDGLKMTDEGTNIGSVTVTVMT